MAFTDHKISAFTHKISDLADQPNMPPDELKARFDACPEQLRVSLNAVCDEAAALDSKVDGIVTGTFEGAIDKNMLSPELTAEIDATVTQNELETAVGMLESTDSALSTRVSSAEGKLSTHTNQIAQKCQAYAGTYTGDGAENRVINLGFRPKAVLVMGGGYSMYYNAATSGGLVVDGTPVQIKPVSSPNIETVLNIVSNGFQVTSGLAAYTNSKNSVYFYLALR